MIFIKIQFYRKKKERAAEVPWPYTLLPWAHHILCTDFIGTCESIWANWYKKVKKFSGHFQKMFKIGRPLVIWDFMGTEIPPPLSTPQETIRWKGEPFWWAESPIFISCLICISYTISILPLPSHCVFLAFSRLRFQHLLVYLSGYEYILRYPQGFINSLRNPSLRLLIV